MYPSKNWVKSGWYKGSPHKRFRYIVSNNATLPYGGGVVGRKHRGRVTHICVANLTIIGSDNGFSPGRREAIIWTNAWILLIGP